MNVAITGASGFLGGYIAAELQRQGHEVRGQVRESSDDSYLKEIGAEVVLADLEDFNSLRGLLNGCDAVIHNGLHRCPGGARDNFRYNVGGSLELLELSVELGLEQFLFVSSCVVHEKILDDRPLDEAHPLSPSNPYGAYKAAVEAFCNSYHRRHGLNTSAWRPSEIYGIRRGVKGSNWYDIVQDVKAGKKIDVDYGGKIVRVEDVASAMVGALGRLEVAGEVFNLTDCHIYRQQVAEYAKEFIGSSSEISDYNGPGPKHQIDCSKAISLRLFEPKGHEGVKDYIRRLLGTV